MSDETVGMRPLSWGAWGWSWASALTPRRLETWFTLAIAGLFVGYAWRLEGTNENILYTLGVSLVLAALLAVATRRMLFSATTVAALAIAIYLAASTKRAVMNMVVHAYDLFFYLSSWSTITFLVKDQPAMVGKAAATLVALIALGWFVWRFDRTRVSRTSAGLVAIAGLLVGVYGWAGKGERRHMQFHFENLYLSSFYASWGETVGTLWNGSMMDAGPRIGASPLALPKTCSPDEKPPHIVLIHQESLVQPELFLPGLKYDRAVDPMFRSQDGNLHKMRVETYGGASWLTEFSLLAGVSTQSFGGMRQFVQTFMVNKLQDTLPQRLEQCGYRNVLFYPVLRNFVSNDKFYASIGIKDVRDMKDQGAATSHERDHVYFRNAVRDLEQHIKTSDKPSFTFIQTMSAHWPYDWVFEKDEQVPGGGPGTHPDMHEYLRRVSMAKMDYDELIASLKAKFPGEKILVVQYGDHQPAATRMLVGYGDDADIEDVKIDDGTKGFITYYAFDGINYQVPDTRHGVALSQAVDVPYLGTLIQSAAGLPLTDAGRERLRLMQVCQGRYFNCAKKQEILAFHRRLLDSGIIVAR
jgi:hypothetical protein